MPQTPFAGLSVVIHLLIILIFTLFQSILPKKSMFAFTRTSKRLTALFCLMIIVTIFSFVLLNATQMVYRSLDNEHSSVRYISTFVDSVESESAFEESKHAIRTKASGFVGEVIEWWAGTNGAALLLTIVNKYD